MKTLYVFDIDNTLKPKIGPIPKKTQEAICQLTKCNDSYVALATGRCYHEAMIIAKKLGINYLITSGGKQVYIQNHLVDHLKIDRSDAINYLKQRKLWHLIVSNQSIYSYHFPRIFKLLGIFRHLFSKQSSAYYLFSYFAHVQSIQSPTFDVDTIDKILVFSIHRPPNFSSYLPFFHSLEFEDKGRGIKILKEYLNDISQVIVFGDSSNDITMFQMSDKAYATSKASKQILPYVDEVIDFRQGIAKVLKKV